MLKSAVSLLSKLRAEARAIGRPVRPRLRWTILRGFAEVLIWPVECSGAGAAIAAERPRAAMAEPRP